MFDILTSLPDLISETSTSMETLGTSFGNITTSITDILDLSSITPPVFSNALGSINTSFNLYTITSPSMSDFISTAGFPTDFIQKLDDCHQELTTGGIASILQKAGSMVLDAILASIIAPIQTAISLFQNPGKTLSGIYEWLEEQWNQLWESLSYAYKDWFVSREEIKEEIDDLLEKGETEKAERLKKLLNTKILWDRAVDWIEKTLKEFGTKLTALKTAITDFGTALINVGKNILPKLLKCLEDLAELPADVLCLMKTTTEFLKS